MKVYHAPQGSEQWFAMRRGRPTASRFDEIVTPKKCEPSKGRKAYIRELIAECFCPTHESFFGTPWTDRGNDLEAEARAAFERHTGLTTEQVGFCTREDGIVGCSPDSLITSGGTYTAGLEIKCPSPKVHVGYVLDGVLPADYLQQVHGGMAVTGLPEWHFWSYYPGLQPLHIIVQRDAYTAKLEAAIDQFLIDYGAARVAAVPRLRTKPGDSCFIEASQ